MDPLLHFDPSDKASWEKLGAISGAIVSVVAVLETLRRGAILLYAYIVRRVTQQYTQKFEALDQRMSSLEVKAAQGEKDNKAILEGQERLQDSIDRLTSTQERDRETMHLHLGYMKEAFQTFQFYRGGGVGPKEKFPPGDRPFPVYPRIPGTQRVDDRDTSVGASSLSERVRHTPPKVDSNVTVHPVVVETTVQSMKKGEPGQQPGYFPPNEVM